MAVLLHPCETKERDKGNGQVIKEKIGNVNDKIEDRNENGFGLKRCSTSPLQGNADPNHSDVLSHTCQSGYYQKDKNKCWQNMEKRELSCTVSRNVSW